jgi:Zn-dependent protease with chaperone function
MFAVVLGALLAAAPTPEEPHPFAPSDQALFDSVSQRVSRGERDLEAPLQRLLDAAPDNPRAHQLAGIYYSRLGDATRMRAQYAFQLALKLKIAPLKRHADTLARLALVLWPIGHAAAQSYMDQALAEAPDEPSVFYMAAILAMRDGRAGEARPRLERVAGVAPRSAEVQGWLALARWKDGDLPGAAEAVARARALGAHEPFFDQIESQLHRDRWLARAGLGLAAAALTLVVVLGVIALAGLVLSRAQIRSLADVHAHLEAGERTRAEARVDALYRVVLWAAAALLFAALPMLVVVTLGVGAGVIWAFFALHYLPIQLMALVGVATAVALYGLIRGLFLSRPPEEGQRPTRADEPGLYRLLDGVATATHSPRIDQVVLQPGPGVGVFEEGSTLAVLAGRGKRVLALGYGVLPHLTVGELCAVVAHEYGHFSHGETRLTPILWRVEASSVQMLMGMAASGKVVMFNPAFWFLRSYVHVYLRISRGQGRRRELLADRVAALTYGGETFARALTHVSEASEDLSRAVDLLRALRTAGVGAGSLYQLQDLKRVQTAAPLRAALTAEREGHSPDRYDTHPPVAERVARVAGIRGSRLDDRSAAVSLLARPDQSASELAALVLTRLPDPDPDMPQPARSADEVVQALSAVQDARGSCRHGLPGSLAMLESALEALSTALGPEHTFLADQLRELAEARRRAGDEGGAEAALHRAEEIDAGEGRRRAEQRESGPRP